MAGFNENIGFLLNVVFCNKDNCTFLEKLYATKFVSDIFEDSRDQIWFCQSNTKIKLINDLNPQLVFLDIQLQDGDGFEILDHFSNSSSFEVIFTTGPKDYKEKAMDYFAFYYLNKPIQEDRLIAVVDKFLAKQYGRTCAFKQKKLLVSSRNKTNFLRILKLMNYSVG